MRNHSPSHQSQKSQFKRTSPQPPYAPRRGRFLAPLGMTEGQSHPSLNPRNPRFRQQHHTPSHPIIHHHRNHSSKTQFAANCREIAASPAKTAAKHPLNCRKLPLERQVSGKLRQLQNLTHPEISPKTSHRISPDNPPQPRASTPLQTPKHPPESAHPHHETAP